MDEIPDTFVQVGDALPPWLQEIRKRMESEKRKRAA
jgi:hypothetical protein